METTSKTLQQCNNFKEVCDAIGIPDTLPFDVSMLKAEKQRRIFSDFFMMEICEFANKGKGEFDYRRGNNQPKYFIWPTVEANNEFPSGFGLSVPIAISYYVISSVGSWLCFLDAADANHAFEIMPELYKNWHLKIVQ